MSLILDALARAERERRRADGGAPDLLADQPVGAVASTRWPWIAAGLVVLVAALLVWRWTAVPVPPAVPAPSPAREAPVAGAEGVEAAPRPLPTVPSRASEPPAAVTSAASGDDAAVAALYGEAAAARVPPRERVAAEVTAVAPAPVIGAGSAVEAARRGDSVPADKRSAAEAAPLDVEQVLQAVRNDAAAAGLQPHPVPLLADQSKQFRDSVPTLMYLRHDYRARGGSTILVNGEVLGVGQRTRNVEVREILPDSAVFRFGGTDFRLRALNSWVNL